MKILYVTTIGATMDFFKSIIRELLDSGCTVDIATNETDTPVPDCYREWGCKVYPISCSRSVGSKGNLDAVRQIRCIAEDGAYDIVHCHTPIASVCTRLACRRLRKEKGLRVFYTAHGFHFYKGAPLKNWLVYYPVEKLCAHFTDVMITINREDYERAEKRMKAGKVEYVPGVGIDIERFANTVVDRTAKRKEIGVPEDAFMLLSVGELNANKNHQIVIKALSEMTDESIHYVVAGEGELHEQLQQIASDLGIADRVHLLGFRRDVAELYKTAGLYIHASFREGLSVAVMEAIASKCPTVCSKCRGSVELVGEDSIFDQTETEGLKRLISSALAGGFNNTEQNFEGLQGFGGKKVNEKMMQLYEIGE